MATVDDSPAHPEGPTIASELNDVGWVQLGYDGGSGNFPLWESEVLRPVFRYYFRDWQNFDVSGTKSG